MPCESAIIEDFISISPDASVGEALQLLEDRSIRSALVVDEENNLLGMVTFQQIIKSVLPFSATMEEGPIGDLQFMHAEADEVAERLSETKQKFVRDIMETDLVTAVPTTTFLEILFLLYKTSGPIPVLNPDTGKLRGVVTKQSALLNLDKRYPQE